MFTMADAFSVDPEALADAIEWMGEFVRHIKSVIAEINSLVTHLHSTWSGQAAAATPRRTGIGRMVRRRCGRR